MKRLHIHVAVENLETSIRFYSTLFGAEPVKQKADYAKWLLEDPQINFAISSRGRKPGLDHLGIDVDEDGELSEVRERLAKAGTGTFDEGETACCYSRADKTWVMDPAGLPWEAYRNMADVEMFGTERDEKSAPSTAATCCVPSGEKPKPSRKNAVRNRKPSPCG